MRMWLIMLGVFLAAGIGILARREGPWKHPEASLPWKHAQPVVQPIAFNHKRHLAEGLSCKDCHKRAETGPHATIPPVKACMLCHSEAKGTDPEEAKVRAFAEAGHDIPWIQVNRLPGHVYFSHAAHVGYAKMDCAECHGDMKDRTEPVTVSQIGHLTMDRCMTCHQSKGVSLDCLRCHK